MMDGGGLDASGQPRKDNTKMMLIAIIGAGFLIALAIVLVVLLKKPDAPVAAPVTAPTDTGAAPTGSVAPPTATVATAPSAAPAATDAPGSPQAPSVGGAVADNAHHGGGGGTHHGGGSPGAQAAPFIPPAPQSGGGGGGGGGGAKSLADALKASAGGGGGDSTPAAAQASTAQFDRGAAAAALGSVNVGGCKKSDGPTGPGHVKVTFSPSGSVASAVVDQPPFAGTAIGGCVAGKFRGAHIPAFGGAPISVGKSFVIE
jgi:hypothetical protein